MARFENRLGAGWQFALGLALVALTIASSRAGFIVFEAAGADAAATTSTRDAFRAAVGGGSVAGANGSFGGLRREINWDGVPDALADPNALPANFFNLNSPRGAVFSTPGTGFLVSANSGQATPALFGFANDFQTFSAQRLFTASNSDITDVAFFLPGTTVGATTSAFGLFFVDVEVAGGTLVEFFDQNNSPIFARDALVAGNQGLSFLGAVANAGETISRVRIISGVNTIVSNSVLGNPNDDVVVMDDFLYAEPASAAAPEPATIALLGVGLAGVAATRRRKLRSFIYSFQRKIAMRSPLLGWLSIGTVFFVVGCALPAKIVQPIAGDQTRPVTQLVVSFDKAYVPGTFQADLSGTTITNLFKPTPVPNNVSTALIEFPQFMDYDYINSVTGGGAANQQLLRVSAKSSSNGSCCDSVTFSPLKISVYRGGPGAVTYDNSMPVRERETINATVWVKDAPREPLNVMVTGHPSVSLNEQPAGQSIPLVIPTNDNRVDFRIRGIVLSGEVYQIRAIATGYSSTLAGGYVLPAQ